MNNDRIHITLVANSLAVGGAERVAVNMANELQRREYNVEIVLVHKEGELLDKVDDGIQVTPLQANRILSSANPLRRYLNQESPDILISFTTGINVMTLLARLVSRTRPPVIVTEHTTQSRKKSFSSKRESFLGKILYPSAARIVAVSDGVAEDVSMWSTINKNEIKVIHNPIITDKLLRESEEEISHPFFDSTIPVIVSAGRFVPEKDFPTLVTAFRSILTKIDAKLILLGDGPERDHISDLVSEYKLTEHVSMPGMVENPYPFMRESSVFALPSRVEGFGNVLVESMACGTPVVATNCSGGPGMILGQGEYGQLVPIESPEELAQGILRSLQNPIDESKLKKRAADFSVERIMNSYEQVIDNEILQR